MTSESMLDDSRSVARLLALLLLACGAAACGGVSRPEDGDSQAPKTFDAVFTSDDGAFAVWPSGTVTPLGSVTAYCFSPDRTLVALGGSDDSLGEIVSASGTRRSLPMHGAPAWSPDSTRLAFSRGGVPFIAKGTGEAARAVDVEPIDAVTEPSIAWSPDGGYVAFSYFVTAEPPSAQFVEIVLLIEARTRAVLRFAGAPTDNFKGSLRFSPTSSRVAFRGSKQDFVVMDIDGGNSVSLPTTTLDGVGGWSYDGSWFAMGNVITDANGSTSINLDSGHGYSENLAWSPVSVTLAYADLAGLHLWKPRGHTSWPDAGPTDVAWSPDGRYLAYEGLDQGVSGSWVSVVIDPRDGSESVRIPTASVNLGRFAWSPNGQRLLAITTDIDLQVANAGSSSLRTLASGVTAAAWLPDGDQIAFATDGHVSRARASDGSVEEIWSGSGNVGFVQLPLTGRAP